MVKEILLVGLTWVQSVSINFLAGQFNIAVCFLLLCIVGIWYSHNFSGGMLSPLNST